MDEEGAAAWVSGLIDADGCVYSHQWEGARGRRERRVVTVTVTDMEIADHYADCLSTLNIPYSRYDRPGARPGYRHKWTVDVQVGRALKRLNEVAVSQCGRKRLRLQEIVSSFSSIRDGCAGCGCPCNDRTDGCVNCRKRHDMRDRVLAKGDAKKAADRCGPVIAFDVSEGDKP